MKKYKYAILLGYPTNKDGSLSHTQIKRCEAALKAYQKGEFDTLIISGGESRPGQIEAERMKEWFEKRNGPPVLLEKEALNTWKNFEYVRKMIEDDEILIITSLSHVARSKLIANHFFKKNKAVWAWQFNPYHWFRELLSLIVYFQIERSKKKKN